MRFAPLAVLITALTLPVQAKEPVEANASASLKTYGAQYRAYVRGILIANVDVRFALPANGYHLSAKAKAAGLGRVFSSSSAQTHSYGAIENGAFEPQNVLIAWQQGDEIKQSEIGYKNGAPASFRSDYPLPPERQPKTAVDISLVGTGTNDPFLAMLGQITGNDLRSVCDAPKRLFDGRRLANLVPKATQTLEAGEHGFKVAGSVLECQTKWQPVAGYSEESLQNAEAFDLIDITYARIEGTDFAAPVHAVTSTRYGRFTIKAKQFFEPLDPQMAP
ncbi:DUF3108 domain-containing protein [Alphaproteobacteria bacterium]|nr:DUF3108 domain-containing protein [Alphaproteobacteria bacterium]